MKIDTDKVTVKDVMQNGMVVLQISDPTRKAIELFEDHGISGAPVIGEDGSLCGVLTASDLLPLGTADAEAVPIRGPDSSESDELAGEESAPVRHSSPAAVGQDRVGDWMTPEILTVAPDATLGEVCALMDRETVHRVFVTHGDQLHGVVSTTDIVRYIAD